MNTAIRRVGLAGLITAVAFQVGCKNPSTVGEIAFADSKFKECVTQVYSEDMPVTAVIELNCQSKPIKSLAGAQWMAELRILRMEGPNSITSLEPVSKLSKFSILSLYGISEALSDVKPLITAPGFTELYVENGPSLDCEGISILRQKLGENYVVTGNGFCQE